MSINNLSSLTVVELRKLAKENQIKLSTGLTKELIIEKLTAALAADGSISTPSDDANEMQAVSATKAQDAVQDKPKAVGWQKAAHNYSTKPAYQAPVQQSRASWQNGKQIPRQPQMHSDFRSSPPRQQPTFTPRFGPAAAQSVAAPAQTTPVVPPPPPPIEPRSPYNHASSGTFEPLQRKPRRDPNYYNSEYATSNPAVPEILQKGECGDGAGLLEIHSDGYGFLRPENFLPSHQDIYVSMAQIRRFSLRTGDYVVGKTRPKREGDKYSALLYITEVNGQCPDDIKERPAFEQLTPIYPTRHIALSCGEGKASIALRMMDLIVPIGFGQRGLIIAPPQPGKRRLLIEIANAITKQYENAHVMMMLIDTRPEDVTEVRDHVTCEVLSSTFDRSLEHHARVAEMVFERSQRLCEAQKDVVVLVDNLTSLARAYNNIAVQTGRGTPGMLNPSTLYKTKKLFGSARNLREGGSLTVIGVLSGDSNNRFENAIAEEFKGTATMELYLTEDLAKEDIYPPFDLKRSNTRRDELLITKEQQDGLKAMRSLLTATSNSLAVKQLIEMMDKTQDNIDLLSRLKDWIVLFNRGGIQMPK